jgi:L-ascorbate metabolism protein UlaG (beta-lactamase superfamily)
MRHLFLAALMIAVAQTGGAVDADVTITPIIHASVQIEYDGRVIQVDPWSAGDLTRARPADLILISDDPVHHLDPVAIRRLRKAGAPVLLPPAAQPKFPEGTVIANGESRTVAGIAVAAIAAYDIKPGEPSHPKGKANGYVVTLGATRVYLAGVTECVPEVRALRNIDIAFVPMNIPLDRMTPSAAAECVKAINPKRVYVYHYDQTFASTGKAGANMAATLRAFREALKGTPIEIAEGVWYPYEEKH